MSLDIEDVIRAIISLIFVALYAYTVITGNDTSQFFQNTLLILIGFYFGLNELGKVAGKFYQAKREGRQDATKRQ